MASLSPVLINYLKQVDAIGEGDLVLLNKINEPDHYVLARVESISAEKISVVDVLFAENRYLLMMDNVNLFNPCVQVSYVSHWSDDLYFQSHAFLNVITGEISHVACSDDDWEKLNKEASLVSEFVDLYDAKLMIKPLPGVYDRYVDLTQL